MDEVEDDEEGLEVGGDNCSVLDSAVASAESLVMASSASARRILRDSFSSSRRCDWT